MGGYQDYWLGYQETWRTAGRRKKLQWKKSEKSQRIGRKELGEKKKKEIKELEARCREAEVPRGSCSKTGKLIFHFMYITLSHKNLELPNSRI